MIRISLILISIFSLLYNLVFFFTPYFFVEMTHAETINIVSLEILEFNIRGIVLLNYFLVYRSQTKNYDLFTIITVISILQNLA